MTVAAPRSNSKKKILVFCDAYLPGTRGGGGVWTVVNLVDRFHDRYDFYIVTRNRDSRDDRQYTSVKTGEWNTIGNASVYYAADNKVRRSVWARLIDEVRPDAVFLNSMMSTPCVTLLAARRQGMIGDVPVIVAPCGELSPGALARKPIKKKTYLASGRATGFFNGVIWKATTDVEAREIRLETGTKDPILIAPDLTPKTILPDLEPTSKPKKTRGTLRLIFYSRIVPKKNLRFLLEVLKGIDRGNVRLQIVGPAENESYWRDCQSVIATLPENISVEHTGAVTYAGGLELLVANHLFVLPTLGENFGYVIVESLAAGTPVLSSDKVVWTDLEEKNAGRLIPLKARDEWRRAITRYIDMDTAEFGATSACARQYALDWLARPDLEQATADMFAFALGRANG